MNGQLLKGTVAVAAAIGMSVHTASAQTVGVYRGASGAKAASTASAGSVVASTPIDAFAWNPAGLASIDAPQVDLAIGALSARGRFTNRVDDAGDLGDATGLVPDGAFAFPLRGRTIVIGGGLVTDGAIAGSWSYRDAPGAAGASYGVEINRSGVVVLRPTGGVAARVNRWLDVGASASMVWNRNELQAPYIFQSQAPLIGLKTLLDVHATGIGFSGSLGAIVRPHRRVVGGVSWRSATSLTTHGEASGDAWAQFAALGVAADATFEYDAAVRNSFPSMLAAGAAVDVTPRWRVMGQIERWGWHDAFQSLPITLTNGTNTVINSLVGSATINELVPLGWNDQTVSRVGSEVRWSESLVLRGGYARTPSPVPTNTLTPMTAAIIEDTFGVGVGFLRGNTQFDIGFHWSPQSERSVADTALRGSEYDGTWMSVGAQGIVFGVRHRLGR
jgi:long-subunit fatty acid transport protein